jgi:hypothetical protein
MMVVVVVDKMLMHDCSYEEWVICSLIYAGSSGAREAGVAQTEARVDIYS